MNIFLRNHGNKINNLLKIKKYLSKTKIPDYRIIPYHFFNSYLKNNLSKQQQQNIIQNINFKKNNNIIIRSSSNLEDNKKVSFAGIFTSISNNKKNDILNNILTIYSQTKESMKLIDIYKNKMRINKKLKLSLMIQEQIDCDISGVIFSNSPIYKYKKCYHIEFVDNNSNDFEDNINHKILILNKNLDLIDIISEKKDLNKNQIELIKILIKEIPNKFYPFDIEFGIKNNEIYLFQIRPITIIN